MNANCRYILSLFSIELRPEARALTKVSLDDAADMPLEGLAEHLAQLF
jgi:hypothetical protein